MLSEAVAEEKAAQEGTSVKETTSMRDCKIDLPIDAHIPESYVSSVNHRLGMYRRIADIRNQEDADDVLDELLDRFGEPPAPVTGLIHIALIRAAAAQHGIFEIGLGGERAALYIEALDMPLVQTMAEALPGRVKVSAGAGRPYIAIQLKPKTESMLETLQKAFGSL